MHALPPSTGCQVALILFVLFLAQASPLVAQTKEYEVKAVFLYNFSQFIKWPAAAFADGSSPLVIGVLGDDPFGSALQSAVRGEKASGRRVQVRSGRRIEDLRGCQFIFVSRSESSRISEILAGVQGSNVLTVGESDRFCDLGGVISFTLQSGKVGFEINVAAARRAGLEISPKLLRLGKIHHGG